MKPIKLEIHTRTEQFPKSIERVAPGNQGERQLSKVNGYVLETVDIAQTIPGNAAFHVRSYRGFEKVILGGHGEFPTMANGGYACCLLNRVRRFIVCGEASRGKGN